MWSKWQFFNFFSKTALTILAKMLQNVELINSEHLPKTACPKKISVLEIFIHKVQILAKNDKSGVQRMPYSSGTVNATENLIWYSESTINFLSCTSNQIFTYFTYSTSKRPISMHFLSGFRPFSRQPPDIFRRNLVRSETKWIQSRCKRPEAFLLSHLGDI